MSTPTYYRFAQAYGEGAYNSCTYNCVEGQSSTAPPSSSPGSTGGPLANTGVAVTGIVTLACLIALIAILVRVWRRPAAQEVPIDDELSAGAGPEQAGPER